MERADQQVAAAAQYDEVILWYEHDLFDQLNLIQVLNRLGCDDFEIYEQVGANWSSGQATGRYVQIMRFRDRRHQVAVQAAERDDKGAQELIAEFCALINYPYQQQQQQFAVGFYSSVLPIAPGRGRAVAEEAPAEEAEAEAQPS